MGIMAVEGIVDRGRIRLKGDIRLPERTRVYLIAPDLQIEQVVHISSPRLAHPEKAADFKMEVLEEPDDAGV